MRIHRQVLPVLVAALIGMPSTAWAQSRHVADPAAMQQAIQTKVAADAADRALVLRVLKSSAARAVADRLGLNLTRAQAGVATLEGAELAGLAASARSFDSQLSGGADTIVISTTTLVIIVLLVLLLAR